MTLRLPGFCLSPTLSITVIMPIFFLQIRPCQIEQLILVLSHGDGEGGAPITIIEESSNVDNMTTISPEENMKNSSGSTNAFNIIHNKETLTLKRNMK